MLILAESHPCPKIPVRSLAPSSTCATCFLRSGQPYARIEPGQATATCSHCGQMGIPTSTNPLFAGYLGDHSRWHEGRWAPCPGTHHAHGGPTAERSGQPGWSPLAHLRAGDVIRVHEYSLPYCQDHQILYIRPSTGNRLHVSWLIERGTGGWFVAPGTPVLLVRPVDGPPPEPHYRVAFRNAISSHGRESHCYATVDEARVSARDHRPWNNTASAIHECWRPECRPVS